MTQLEARPARSAAILGAQKAAHEALAASGVAMRPPGAALNPASNRRCSTWRRWVHRRRGSRLKS